MSSTRRTAVRLCLLVLVLCLPMLVPVGALPSAEAQIELQKVNPDRTLSLKSGTIQFQASEFLVLDGFWRADVYITRTGGSAGEIGFGVQTVDGTAVAGVDYHAWDSPAGNLRFKHGDTETKRLEILVEIDPQPQPDRSFTVHLSTLDRNHLGDQSSTTVTIRDFDLPANPDFVETHRSPLPRFSANPSMVLATRG